MATIAELARWVRTIDQVAVVAHVSPDGDALGSALALTRMLRRMDKRACVVSTDFIPSMYHFLPGVDEVEKPEQMPFAAQAIFYVDVASIDRVGDRGVLCVPDAARAALDHHGTNPGFCAMSVVDAQASASGLMVMRLMDALGIAPDLEMAICLYTAISTDTGNFSFSNTTQEAFYAVGRLMETGFDLSEVNRKLFRLRSVPRTMLLGRALNNMEQYADGAVALTRITQEMFNACNADHAQTEGIINYLVEMQGVRVALTAEERGEEATKFSLRSSDGVDVSAIAHAFGGGGHHAAAGMTLPMGMDEAVRLALDSVLKAL